MNTKSIGRPTLDISVINNFQYGYLAQNQVHTEAQSITNRKTDGLVWGRHPDVYYLSMDVALPNPRTIFPPGKICERGDILQQTEVSALQSVEVRRTCQHLCVILYRTLAG